MQFTVSLHNPVDWMSERTFRDGNEANEWQLFKVIEGGFEGPLCQRQRPSADSQPRKGVNSHFLACDKFRKACKKEADLLSHLRIADIALCVEHLACARDNHAPACP